MGAAASESRNGQENGCHETETAPAFSFATCFTMCRDPCEANSHERWPKSEYDEWAPRQLKQCSTNVSKIHVGTVGAHEQGICKDLNVIKPSDISLAEDSSLLEIKGAVSQENHIESKFDTPVRIAVRPGRRSPSPVSRSNGSSDTSHLPLNGRQCRSKSPARRAYSPTRSDRH